MRDHEVDEGSVCLYNSFCHCSIAVSNSEQVYTT